jgi:hypothetical protein
MGNPPKKVVYSKLIRRYFKKRAINFASEEATKLKNELIRCWETNGVDHPKCEHLVPKYDRAWALDLLAKEKYE